MLEYVEGGELYQYIQAEGSLDEPEAIRIFRQMLAGLQYCHRFNIYHRDLKPENILLDGNSNVRIVDFGFAALQPEGEYLRTCCGSPHYAAPEVVEEIPYSGDKSDIWSCGVILYAMLCGYHPFESAAEDPTEAAGEIMYLVVNGSYEFPEHMSREAKDLIYHMLQKNPKRRMSMDQIWEHPLLRKYRSLDDFAWIGPPPPLTVGDCGQLIKKREHIDEELLRNLHNLWHIVGEEDVARKLLSDE